MNNTKEKEIQLQFLEEATEHLNTLEAVLLEVKSYHRIEQQKINGALRAAHSIKGGAAIMGFRALSDLAHKLEDNFKVLKTQKNSLEVDASLQGLLLSAVDLLRQIVEIHAREEAIEEEWLASFCDQIFAELHDRLGDPVPEDAMSILSPEDGQLEIIPLIFQTEVEDTLQRLESLLNEKTHPGTRSEIVTMAQELGGLGEMLQLEAFTKLCQSVSQRIEAASDNEVADAGRLALQVWRRSQALVFTNQIESLPAEIPADLLGEKIETKNSTPTLETAKIQQPANLNVEQPVKTIEPLEEKNPEPSPSAIAYNSTSQQLERPKQENQENTVRVSVKHLEEINDLFGEITIQRNSLNVQLERLQKLVRSLNQRVKTLERENHKLRVAYDKTTLRLTQQRATEKQEKLNQLLGKFDALEMDSYNELHLLSQTVMETIVQIQEVTTDIEISLDDTDQISRQLNKTGKHLQKTITQVRMRPLSDLVDRFPRALHELSVEYGKNVQLKIEGGQTLIERNILEALNEPLLHLLRNSFDHGIEDPATRSANGKPEQGLIEIKAAVQGNRTLITISDDGRGISLEKIRNKGLNMGLDPTLLAQASDDELLSLIFEPGFSTSDRVTALSGRGVGMDVVRNNLKQIRGDIAVDTKQGQGTTFTLSVPFTLSVTRVLLVESNKMLVAFPTDAIAEIFMLQNEQVLRTTTSEAINWQGSIIQLIRLGRHLNFNCPHRTFSIPEIPATIDTTSALIIKTTNTPVAVQVDRCWGEQEVAIRRVEGSIPLPQGFSNCTILGDGRVVPLVSTNELLYSITTSQMAVISDRFNLPEFEDPSLASALDTAEIPLRPNSKERGCILIVDDSINIRRFLALTLEKAGYCVEQAKDGQDALEKLQEGLQVHAMICDVEMPRLDGYGLLVRLKSHNEFKHIPIAMLTSRSGDKHRLLAMQLGAYAYFSKPYNEHELLQAIEEMIFAPVGV